MSEISFFRGIKRAFGILAVMTFIIFGCTKCVLCQQLVQPGDYIVIPNYIGNTLDPLYTLSGSVLHKDCANENEDAQKILSHYNFVKSLSKGLVCWLTNEPILNPDDFLDLVFFTMDTNHTLYPYNCMVFHRKNFKKWEKRFWIIEEIERLHRSDEWGGETLKTLANYLRRILEEDK